MTLTLKEARRAVAAGLLALATFGATVAAAAFSGQTSNPAGTLTAASSFSGSWLATGSYLGNATDNRNITGLPFQPELVIVKAATTQDTVIRTSTMSGDSSRPVGTATALSTNRIQALSATGFQVGTNAQVNSASVTYHWTAFNVTPGRLAVGSYLGLGLGHSITGAGFSPEYAIVVPANANESVQRSSTMTGTRRFSATTSGTGITSLDSDGFTVGTSPEVNSTSVVYHYVLFNAVSSITATGSYSGNGSDNRSITTPGFTPDYVITRPDPQSTSTCNRSVARPVALTEDRTLHVAAVATVADGIQSFETSGFQVGTLCNVNTSATTYHWMAFRDG